MPASIRETATTFGLSGQPKVTVANDDIFGKMTTYAFAQGEIITGATGDVVMMTATFQGQRVGIPREVVEFARGLGGATCQVANNPGPRPPGAYGSDFVFRFTTARGEDVQLSGSYNRPDSDDTSTHLDALIVDNKLITRMRPANADSRYTLKPGDTLVSLAKEAGWVGGAFANYSDRRLAQVFQEALLAVMPHYDPSSLTPGETITLPRPGRVYEEENPGQEVPRHVWICKSGDGTQGAVWDLFDLTRFTGGKRSNDPAWVNRLLVAPMAAEINERNGVKLSADGKIAFLEPGQVLELPPNVFPQY